MKKSSLIFGVFLTLLFACSPSTDTEPEQIESIETEASTDAYLSFYNASVDVKDIKIRVDGSEKQVDLSKNELSPYYWLGKGQHTISITNSETGETLVTKEISMLTDEFYSSFLYKNAAGEFDLVINNDFNKLTKAQGSLTAALDLVAVNLASNIPAEKINVVNSFTYISANCGANVEHCTIKCSDLKQKWVEELSFGTAQNIIHAPLSRSSNFVHFVSSEQEQEEFPVVGFIPTQKKLTVDPTGSGNLQTIERPNNLSVGIDTKVVQLLILQDMITDENEEAVFGRLIELSTNDISDVRFD